MELDLDRVHVREPGMTGPELLMSESQERMMAFVARDRLEEVLEVADRREIQASVVGKVISGGQLRVLHGGQLVAEVPAVSLTDDAPRYERPLGEPGLWSETVGEHCQVSWPSRRSRLRYCNCCEPELGSKSWVYEQYDPCCSSTRSSGQAHYAALLRVKGTNRGLALSTDGNGRMCYLDPRRGAARLVFEAALNVAVVGAEPLAVVDNLNFGNPEKPEVMWQFRETVEGLAEACEALEIPVIGGNVSFYNETDGLDIYPTPVVGMLGLVENLPTPAPRLDRVEAGMDLWLFGPEWSINLAGSAFEKITFAHVGGRPSPPDPTMAKAAIARRGTGRGRLPAIHDISTGGTAIGSRRCALPPASAPPSPIGLAASVL